MKNVLKKGFTLVELLVVITILAIISVVAYQSYSGVMGKTYNSRKTSDIATIKTGLMGFKNEYNYYPQPDIFNKDTNMWGYTGGTTNTGYISNTLVAVYNSAEIISIKTASGGGVLYGTGAWSTTQIGAKGTISSNLLTKKYLDTDLYDPELGDTKVGTGKMINYGIGRYVYANFKKNFALNNTNGNGTEYALGYTIKDETNDTYISKIVSTYDKSSCDPANKDNCPDALFGLKDGSTMSGESDKTNQGIPYPVSNFVKG